MGTSVTLNATSYTIPALAEDNWGTDVSNYLIALSTGVLSKAGGAFTLTAEVDFGATYGLKSAYFKSRGTNPAQAGVVRLANAEYVYWRNAANSADLGLRVNSSNVLEYAGNPLVTLALGNAYELLRMNSGGSGYEWAKFTVDSFGSGVLDTDLTSVSASDDTVPSAKATKTALDLKLNLAGGTMTGDLVLAGDPDSSLKAATKQYVDSLINGIKWKAAVRAATTAAGTLASDFEDGDTIDGVTLATGDRILIKNQSTASENGIYVVEASGAPSRASDADAFGELNGAAVLVLEGTTNANRGYQQTEELTALSDNQTWSQNFGTGLYTADGEGLEVSGSTFSLELDGATLAKGASGLKIDDTYAATLVKLTGAQTLESKTLTSPILNTGVSGSAIKDEDNMASDSASHLATQQSIKAYVDTQVASASGVDSVDNAAGASGVTLTSADEIVHVFTPTGDITVKLNNSFAIGRNVRIVNSGSNNAIITVTANDDSTICSIYQDTSNEIQCTTGSPANSGNWSVKNPIKSNWMSFTPTGSWSSNTSYTGLMKRNGSELLCQIKVNLSGTPNDVHLTVDLPSGLTMDTTAILNEDTENYLLGEINFHDDGSTTVYYGPMRYMDSNTLGAYFWNAASTYIRSPTALTGTAIIAVGSPDIAFINFTVPVSGWAEFSG